MKMDKITERVCSWSINTIIWSYFSTAILTSGIKKEGAIFTESQKKQILSRMVKMMMVHPQLLTAEFIQASTTNIGCEMKNSQP